MGNWEKKQSSPQNDEAMETPTSQIRVKEKSFHQQKKRVKEKSIKTKRIPPKPWSRKIRIHNRCINFWATTQKLTKHRRPRLKLIKRKEKMINLRGRQKEMSPTHYSGWVLVLHLGSLKMISFEDVLQRNIT